jgi:hypothetical protein
MALDRQRLEDANRVLASCMQGKTLTEITLAEHGGHITLKFTPLQEYDSLIDFSNCILTIDDDWSSSDKKNPKVLAELSEQLQEEVAKEPASPKYMPDCVLHASDLLRLYLVLGCLRVEKAIIGEDASLTITMDQGIAIHVLGYKNQKNDTDDDSWLLEVEKEGLASPLTQPITYSFAGDQDGELSGYWEQD